MLERWFMDRIEKCSEKFGKLFGGKPVTSEGTDPELMRILQRFIFGEVSYTGSLDDRMRELITYTGSLDDRMRELITVTVLTVNATLPQLEAHTGACLRIGVTPLEVREAIYQCAPFIGFPKVLNAVAAANRAFEKAGVSLPLPDAGCVPDERRYEAGLALQKPLYGDEIKDRYTWLPGEFADAVPRFLTEFGFGDLATRTVLSEKERELLTAHRAFRKGARAPDRRHARRARRSGDAGQGAYRRSDEGGGYRRGSRVRARARHALYGYPSAVQRSELRKRRAFGEVEKGDIRWISRNTRLLSRKRAVVWRRAPRSGGSWMRRHMPRSA